MADAGRHSERALEQYVDLTGTRAGLTMPVERGVMMEEDRSEQLSSLLLNEPMRALEPKQPICVEKGTSVADAVTLMNEHRIGCVLVVENGRLTGIFSERDVLKVLGQSLPLGDTLVDAVMTPDPDVLRMDHELVYALHRMSVGGYRHVPLVDDQRRPVGIVSVRNIVDYIVECFPAQVLTLPPSPDNLMGRGPEGA